MKLDLKLFLYNVLVPLLVIVSISVLLQVKDARTLADRAQLDMQPRADYIAGKMEKLVAEKLQYLQDQARLYSTVKLYYVSVDSFEEAEWAALPEYENWRQDFAAGESVEEDLLGTFIAFRDIRPALSKRWTGFPEGFDSNRLAWFTDTVAANDFTMSEPVMRVVDGTDTMCVTMSYPVYRGGVMEVSSADLIGVAGIDVSMDGMVSTARHFEEELGVSVGLYTVGGTVIYDSGLAGSPVAESRKLGEYWSAMDPGLDAGKVAESLAAFSAGLGSTTMTLAGQRLLVGHTPLALGNWVLVISTPRDAVMSPLVAKALSQNLLTALALLVALVAGAVLVRVSVVDKIKATSRALDAIAHGDADLTAALSVTSNDEIGDLGKNFNFFLGKLRALIDDVSAVIAQITAVNETLSSATVEASASVEQSSAILASMGKETGQLDRNMARTVDEIERITANIESMDARISDQATLVEESNAAIERMMASLGDVESSTAANRDATEALAGAADRGRAQIEDTTVAFREVVEHVGSIREMAEVIAGIASQTDLLSMNAAIEAAHAGEAGRGFAVVAEEIRKLAETAGESSRGIAELVGSITETVDRTDGNVRETSAVFETMHKDIAETVRAFAGIEHAISELEEGGRRVLETSLRIAGETSGIRSDSAGVRTATEVILASAGKIRDASSTVDSGMAEVNAGNAEILSSTQDLVALSEKLHAIVDTLHRKFGAFKTS